MSDYVFVGKDSDTVFKIIRSRKDPMYVHIEAFDIESVNAMRVPFSDIDHLIVALKRFIDKEVS